MILSRFPSFWLSFLEKPDYPTESLLIHVMIYDSNAPSQRLSYERRGNGKLSLNLNNSSIDQESEYEMYMMVPCLWFSSLPRFPSVRLPTWIYQAFYMGVSNNKYIFHMIFSNVFSYNFHGVLFFHSSIKVFPWSCLKNSLCFRYRGEQMLFYRVISFNVKSSWSVSSDTERSCFLCGWKFVIFSRYFLKNIYKS